MTNQQHLTPAQRLMAIAVIVLLFAAAFLDASANDDKRVYLPLVMADHAPVMSSTSWVATPTTEARAP